MLLNIRSLADDSDFIPIVAGVLQGDTSSSWSWVDNADFPVSISISL